MACEPYETALALYVGGDLPVEQAPALETHLLGCTRCREFLRGLESSQELLRSFAEERLDDEARLVRSRVLARIAGRQPAQVPRGRLPAWPWLCAHFLAGDQRRWILLAAGLGLIAIAGLLVGERYVTRQSSPMTTGTQGPGSQTAGLLRPTPAETPSGRDRQAASGSGPAAASVVAQSMKPVIGEVRSRTARASGDHQSPKLAVGDSRSTKTTVGPVSLPAKARSDQALTKEDADQLARAVVVISRRIRDAEAQEQLLEGSAVDGDVVQLPTADPGVVIYWQIDSNGG